MKEIAIAVTPISGDLAAATEKLSVTVITSVAPPSVRRPETIPAKDMARLLYRRCAIGAFLERLLARDGEEAY